MKSQWIKQPILHSWRETKPVKNINLRENKTEAKQKKNYLISNQCFHKQKAKEKQVTTAWSDLDLQILTEKS